MCITEDVKNSYKFPFGTEGREMLAGMNEHHGTSIGRYYFGYWMRRRTRIETSILFGRKRKTIRCRLFRNFRTVYDRRKCCRCGKWKTNGCTGKRIRASI